MIRRIQTGLALRTALGVSALAGLVGIGGLAACGNGNPDPTTGAASGEQSWMGGGGAGPADAASDTQSAMDAGPAPAFHITDCSVPQLAAIFEAINTNEIDAAELALRVSTNSDVHTFAQQMVTDHTNLANQLSAWLSAAGVTIVQGDISLMLQAQGRNEIVQLQSSTRFDRDYASDAVIDHTTAWGFLSTLAVPGYTNVSRTLSSTNTGVAAPQPGGTAAFVAFLANAKTIVQMHLQMAYQLEADVIGACGTAAPVRDAGTADAMCEDAAMEATTTAPATQQDAGTTTAPTASCDGGMSSGGACSTTSSM